MVYNRKFVIKIQNNSNTWLSKILKSEKGGYWMMKKCINVISDQEVITKAIL